MSILLFSLTWILLVDKAFELQGQKIAGSLCEYSNQQKMPAKNYLMDNYYFNSFTPVFTRYQYKTKKAEPKGFEDIELSYTDLWGNNMRYCDADGEFEIQNN